MQPERHCQVVSNDQQDNRQHKDHRQTRGFKHRKAKNLVYKDQQMPK